MKLTFNRLSFVPAFALTLGLCGLAMPAGAQNQPAQTQPPPAQTQKSQKHQTKSVTGCLEQGSNGNFMITAKDGTRYELQPMEGVKLASHVNHEVTVRGMVSPATGMGGMTGSESQRQNEAGGGQASPSTRAPQHTMQVHSIKTIRTTCQ